MNRLRPFTFFPPVEPFRAATVGDLDGLAIDPQCFRSWRGTGLDPNLLAECGVNLLPDPLQTPVAEQPIDRLPGREIVGQHAPPGPAAQVVEGGVDDRAPSHHDRVSALRSAGFGAGWQRVQSFPLLVGLVGWVWFPVRAKPIPNPDFPRDTGFKTHS
jgi:hypothetical protein